MKKKLVVMVLYVSVPLCANQYFNYFWANYQHFGGNAAESEKWYNHLFETPNHSPFTNKGYLHFLNDRGNHKRIVELMPKLEISFKKDPDVQLIFVTALKKTGKTVEADDRIIRLSQSFKEHPEIVFQAAETLTRNKQMKNALALIDNYLNSAPRRPNNFIFYFLKGQIYLHLKEYKLARAQLQQCLEAHPRFPQGWLLMAMLEEQTGQVDQAVKGYSSYLEIAGPNPQIERHLLTLVLKQKASQNNRQLLFVNRSCFQKAMILFERKQYKVALSEINQCLNQNNTDTHSRLLKIQILTAMQTYDETVKTLVAWIDQEPQNAIWYQTLHLLNRLKVPTQKLISALSAIQYKHPMSLLASLYLADLYSRTGNESDALLQHKKAVALTNDTHLKVRILYQIAAQHYERKEYPEMVQATAELEKIQANYAPSLNLQAYYYATAGKNIEKAQQLFEKAYEQDKGNPHFLDTKAVILYKQQKYAQALQLLEPLAQKLAQDSTIHIHLAKTYHKMDNLDAARKEIDHAQQHAQTAYEKKTTAMLAYQWNRK